MRWWPWRRRKHTNGDAAERTVQEAKLRAAQRLTPIYERLADRIAELPADEYVARVRAAMTLRQGE